MKSVAIIGAGPGGLVAAKTLLRRYPQKFTVTIFEKQERVGGLWAVDPDTQGKLLDPNMPTNLSKYTVSFSDLAWESVDLSFQSLSSGAQERCHSSVPMFPKAWHVGRYLETYRKRYIPEDVLRLNCNVTHLSLLHSDTEPKWRVCWTENFEPNAASSRSCELNFDHTIIASGFCTSPRIASLSAKPATRDEGDQYPKIRHSSTVRSLYDIVPSAWSGDGDILIIGGTMSGVEVAASLALQISNRRNAPGAEPFGDLKVIHVTPRPFYVLPQYISQDAAEEIPKFLPLDLCLYDLTRRPAHATTVSFGSMSPDKAQSSHDFLRSKIGGDQSDLGCPALVSSSLREPPYIAIATGASYSEFVRSGQIIPLRGRLESLSCAQGVDKPSSALEATISCEGNAAKTRKVIGAVYATGYTPHIGLTFLSDTLKHDLEYDVENQRLPLILTDLQTRHDGLPGLAFVGAHEGTYWGVEECQSRMIATKWATELLPETYSPSDHNHAEAERTRLRDLRRAIHERKSDVPQLWNGDYTGIMEQCVASGYADRDDEGWNGRHGPVFPARYIDSSCDIVEAKRAAHELQATIESACTKGLFVAHAAFFAMQGSWKMRRDLKSILPTSPSGSFVGIATFEPRNVTDPTFDAEYLYKESGDLTTDQGFRMTATRRYVYRYKADGDLLSAWFVKDDGKTVDYLFLDLSLRINLTQPEKEHGWVFEGQHLCSPDTYDSRHSFQFQGIALKRLGIEYAVSGPKKNYTSTAIYTR